MALSAEIVDAFFKEHVSYNERLQVAFSPPVFFFLSVEIKHPENHLKHRVSLSFIRQDTSNSCQ